MMNRLLRYFPLAAAGFSLFFSLCASPSYAADYVSVKKDGVNIRSGPGTNNPVVMEVFRGFPLKVEETKGSWLRVVDYEDDGGWISKDMTDNAKTVIVISKSSVNMRQEPSTKSGKVADVESGVVLQLIGAKGDWRQVKHSSGTSGWLHESLVWPR
ncbi:MAG: SH3 domain-containing protein [Desulfobulbaceae bacterium]|jgi:SH3-like domain-containing protein|nr:SH3 domain-containing protein [Desulfobulbaceae bacterium]